jgi:hypothetical protein
MQLDGSLRYAQVVGDLLVRLTPHQNIEDLPFARRKLAKSDRIVAIRSSCACVASYRARARSIVFSNLSRVTGFVTKSSAPAFIVWTVVGMSPWALMNTMGRLQPRSERRSCNCNPFKQSICKSSNKQRVRCSMDRREILWLFCAKKPRSRKRSTVRRSPIEKTNRHRQHE